MSPRQIELALKRQRLQLRAAEQRLALRQDLTRFAPAFAVVDSVRTGIAEVKRHPEWLMGAAVVLVVVRPRVVWRLLQRGMMAWQFMRQMRQIVAGLPSDALGARS